MLWFLKRWRVHCDAHWETLRSRPPPSSTVFHFLQVAEVVNTAARNDVRLPGHRWLKPQEVQREDRAAQPEASRGDAGLRTADDRPHCFKGKYTTFHKLIILVIYVIISGYYVTELPAGCLSCFICWLRFLVFNQNFLFSLLAFSMPAYVCQREDEMKTVWWGCSDILTQTLSAETCLFSGFISISGATGNGKVAPLQLSHPPKKLPGAVTSAENGAVLSGRAAACMSADLLFTSTSSSHVESVPMS